MPYKDAEKQRQYKREWERQKRAGEGGTLHGTRNPNPVQIQTAKDILSLLEETINEVKAADADTLVKARCVAYLASVALRAVETGDLAERLEILEMALKPRRRKA